MIEFPITLTSGGSVCLPGRAYALALGYTKNLGVYRLHVDATGEWEGLTIRCFCTCRTAKTRHPRWWWTAMWPCPPA